ncbi:MAG: DNA polymerase I [Chitinophagaceae bacterium]|nr:DNA polymerase I [Chitinophagaceae bacterium]
MPHKLFLLDAMALVFRAYYALIRSPRLTSTGRNTNAQFGFTNTLIDLIQNQKPTHMAVCFDTHAPTEREQSYAEYKANRQDAPEDILSAIPDIKAIVKGMNIPCIEMDGHEADDIIGTLAWQAADAGYEVYMVTPDKDYGQLVRDKIFIYKPGYQGGSVEIMGPAEVCAKWDIARVDQVIDILGLMGDAVDNIPGIPGVGEKTAAKLLKEYDTLEGVLANAAAIKGALGEKVRKGSELAVLSKQLATINTRVPVSFDADAFCLGAYNREALEPIFKELEFKTIGKRLLGDTFEAGRSQPKQGIQGDLFAPAPADEAATDAPVAEVETAIPATSLKTIADVQVNYHLVESDVQITDLLNTLQAQNTICFDTETTHIDANLAELVGMSFALEPGTAWYVPVPEDKAGATALLQKFEPLFARKEVTWIGQNLKYDLLVLKWYGTTLQGSIADTMLMHYVAEPEGKRSMDLLSEQYLGYKPISITELIGKKGKEQGNMRQVSPADVCRYACEDADITLQLHRVLTPLVQQKQVEGVLNEAELPLVKVLTDMEFEGVRIDEGFLNEYSKVLAADADAAEKRVYEAAGVAFNLASPRQLGEVLFDRLKLDPQAKKTKTGQYQTGEDVLLKLAAKGFGIVEDILIYRELTKLRNTYVDTLPQLVNPKTGRVHTSYAQAVAVTGRLSSNNPNLQNIPVRTARGREIRKAFIPRNAGHILLSADYSQIELRIVAALSGDPNMCEAFRQGKDIHTATAALVYKVPETEVTKEMRYKAKSVNFGIIYGQGAFGLADNLGISRTEAKEIIDNYKREFAGITAYMNESIQFAQKHGYVATLLGRKRWLPDINSSNFTVRGFAERNAINTPIQGTAADMIKLAMIKVHHAIQRAGLQSKMILQVHDELIFDAVIDEKDAMKALILENMQEALELPNQVPVVAEAGEGASWLEAH